MFAWPDFGSSWGRGTVQEWLLLEARSFCEKLLEASSMTGRANALRWTAGLGQSEMIVMCL